MTYFVCQIGFKYLKIYFWFYCFISCERSKDPNNPDYVPSMFTLQKNAGQKKEDSYNRLEQFTKRQARNLDLDDENTPEILESTRLKEDLSREDKSTNTDGTFLIENLSQIFLSCQKKV